MIILVKTIGIAIACLAAVFIFSPAAMRGAVAFARVGKRLYGAAAIRLVIGGLLIYGAFGCKFFWLVMAIGILSVLTAIVAAALGLQKMEAFTGWWLAQSDTVLRLVAVGAVILGALLVYGA